MATGGCRLHGGKSTAPRTAGGLARSRRARLVHGARAGDLLALRSAAAHGARRLAQLTDLRREIPAGHGVHRSVFASPPDTPGNTFLPKPPRIGYTANAEERRRRRSRPMS